MENFIPLYDKMLVKRDINENKTEGGLYIPSANNEKKNTGVVIAVGKGKLLPNGELSTMTVKVGDRVMFNRYAGVEIDSENLVIREEELLGII